MTLKNKLKSLRAEHDFNQQDIADYLGIKRTTYHNKETGKNDFTVSEAKQLAQLFNLSIDDIFFTDRVNFKNTNIDTSIVYAVPKVENS